jgi:hypothetical protein
VSKKRGGKKKNEIVEWLIGRRGVPSMGDVLRSIAISDIQILRYRLLFFELDVYRWIDEFLTRRYEKEVGRELRKP